MEPYDITIVGAGPAGVSCALSLLPTDLKVLIIDKENFPRDKICGDALSGDVMKQLKNFFPKVYEDFKDLPMIHPSYGVKIFAPNGDELDINFNKSDDSAPGYTYKRLDFDDFLFRKLLELKPDNFIIKQGFKIEKMYENNPGNEIIIEGENLTFSTKMVVGADGFKSMVKRTFLPGKIEKRHYCAGIRTYMENVKGLSQKNHIELHFLPEISPGYFWIFPVSKNLANVGLGILSEEVSERKLNLHEIFQEIITLHPVLSKRFKQAEYLDELKGYGLPLGSKKRTLSGDHFLLVGDAASLIDPFTGEGIGNALRSGRYAAEHLKMNFAKNDFSVRFNREYDQYIYKKMWREFRISSGIQRLSNYPMLFNFVIKKAKTNSSLKKLLTNMLDDVNIKKELLSPMFYLKLLIS